MFDSIERLTWFLSGSAKRKTIFLEVPAAHKYDSQLIELMTDPTPSDDDNLSESTKLIAAGDRKVCVPKFCSTRWTARVTTLSAPIAKYVEFLKTLEKI